MDLLVNNLHLDVTDEELKNLFSKYGQVISAEIIYNKFNGCSKGYGYVLMKTISDGLNAIYCLDGYIVRGQIITVVEEA